VARVGGQREIGRGPVPKQLVCVESQFRASSGLGARQRTGVVPDAGPVAHAILAVAQHAKVDAAVRRNGDRLDDGRRQRREQQQAEGGEE
jgi:hypothetical protein